MADGDKAEGSVWAARAEGGPLALLMRSILILLMCLFIGTAFAESEQEVQQPVPPVTGNAENTDKPKETRNPQGHVTSPEHLPIIVNAYSQNREAKTNSEHEHINAELSKECTTSEKDCRAFSISASERI